ncbi:MAG: protein kinase, partial [Myxococcota bacterium]
MPTHTQAMLGDYVLDKELGRGGMGVVHLAKHPKHGKVALKRVHEPHAFALASLRSEIALLSRLDHPGVVRLLDHGTAGGLPWMAMELVVGVCLGDLIHPHHQATQSPETQWVRGLATFPSIAPGLGLLETLERWTGISMSTEPTLSAEPESQEPHGRAGAITSRGASSPHDRVSQSDGALPLDRLTLSPSVASDSPTSQSILPAATLNHTLSASALPIPPEPSRQSEHHRLGDAASRTRPALSRQTVLGWLHQLAGTLAYIHGQGIVHADVKPGNIIITATGRVVLLDFGLATRFGSRVEVDTMRRAGMLAGSLSYISPEQCRGEELDARADLYALGCILFEVLAGRPPFVSDTPASMMHQHIHQTPPRLDEVRPGLPAAWDGLATLIAALLAKQRDARPGYAQTVMLALEDSSVNTVVTERAQPRLALHTPRRVGRNALFESLEARLEQSIAGEGGTMVLLSGESGVGKTHLTRELVRRARHMRVQVMVGYASTALAVGHGEDSPLGLFVPILRQLVDRCLQLGEEVSRQVFGDTNVALLSPYAPFIADLPGIEPGFTLPEVPMRVARFRLFDGLIRVLESYCRLEPALIVLEDMHWADELSLGAVEFMMGDLAPQWLLVGTCRAEELVDGCLLQELIDEHPIAVIKVEHLEQHHVEQMAAQML